MKKFFSDLKAFLMRGNIVDMAVGVVVGGAFGKIVTSFVSDIITPLISLITGATSFSEMFVILNPDQFVATETITSVEQILTRADAAACGLATLNWGSFVQSVIDFLIIGVSIFVVLRVMLAAQNKLNAKKIAEEEAAKAAEAAKPAEPTNEEKILQTLGDIKTLLEKK